MKLLPCYTKEQIEIAKKISKYKKEEYWMGIALAEFEFAIQPYIQKFVEDISKDKKFIKSLKKY